MSLDPAAVRRIAALARIDITEAEAQTTRDQLNDIFAMIEAMQAVDTTGVAPMAHAQDVVAALRDDIVTETDRHAEFQAVAPMVERALYLVPKVIE